MRKTNEESAVKISIIVPIFNVEKYLAECLDSILGQSFQDFEIICINDGSTDNSGEILKEYERKDKRIKYYYQKNAGLSAARNKGLEKAKGEYICFLDSDDMYTPDGLRKMYDAIIHYDVDIVQYENAPLLYENGSLQGHGKDDYYQVKGNYEGVWIGRDLFVQLMKNGDFVDSAGLILIRKSFLEKEDLKFELNMLYEDSIFILQSLFKCKKIVHIKEGIYIYRIREQSIMTQKFTYKHQYSRIWQFSECLRMIYAIAQNEDEVNALATYAEQCLASAKYVNGMLEEKDKYEIRNINPLYGMLARGMELDDGGKWCNKGLSFKGLMFVINEAEHVIIYGAGVVGNKMASYLKMNELSHKILGFAVSDQIEPEVRNGRPLKCIKDYELQEDILVIVAARENYHKDMIKMAQTVGFKQIVSIDYEMECVMDSILSSL